MIIQKKEIVCFPIDDYVVEMMGEGYYYCSSLTREYEDGFEETDSTEWFIHPNGTFSGSVEFIYPNEPPQEVIKFEGTFDKSKYNDFVKQMQDYKEDWRKELEYTLYEDSTDFDEEERRMIPRASFDFSQVDPSELPF